MVNVTAPNGWERADESDYRLDNDGRKFVYTNEEKQLEVWIEMMIDEDASDQEVENGQWYSLWGLLRDSDGRELEGPERFTFGGSPTPKEDAVDWLEQTMQQYA